ncbi:MAG TPA: DinB family protein [Anaerolineales bacterium]|nr:DinB family protein [Anaerolineales bacterium]
MNAKNLILDLLQTYKEGIDNSLKDLAPEAWTYQPDPKANHIAVTIWHLARLMDMFVVMRLQNNPIDDEKWFTDGWMEKTGYDPRGKGARGLGVLIGYTPEEMLQVPVLPMEEMKKYFDDTHAALVDNYNNLSPEGLDEQAPGGDPRRTYYEWVKLILNDGLRHTGEILAIKAMCERKQKP